jgi:hypothetical protein
MSVEKLLSIATAPIVSSGAVKEPASDEWLKNESLKKLFEMLSKKNGFYAFEGALHVLPSIDSAKQENIIGLHAWNESSLWRDWYQGITDGLFFFAEDVFGGQFALRGNEVVSFDPETAEIELLAPSFEDWTGELLVNYEQLTGYTVANAWQQLNGSIPMGMRLLPKTPFILGGSYEVSNLYAIDSIKGMRYRGELWEQLRDLPDGTPVKLSVLPLQ